MKSLEFQSALSLNLIAFHKARYNLLTSIADKTLYPFNAVSQTLMVEMYETIMRWNFNAAYGLTEEKIRKLSQKLKTAVECTFADPHNVYRISLLTLIDLYGSSIRTMLQNINGPVLLINQDVNAYLIQLMLHIRHVVHELDNLLFHQEPTFLSIDVFDLMVFNSCKHFLSIDRLDLYNSLGLFEDGITLKIYIEDAAAKNAETRSSLEFMCSMIADKYDVLLIK
jgi:hypothetical protein